MPVFALSCIVAVALTTGVAVTVNPLLDLEVAGIFERPDVKAVVQGLQPYFEALRDYNAALTAVIVLLALGSVAIKLIWPRGRMLMPARAALLIVATFALGPALLVNGVLKPHWPRPRPGAVIELGGTQPFVQWWNPRGECDGNCSFVSGEASAAYAMLAPAAILPPPWRYPAIGAVLVYGTAIGLIRIAAGGHFLTDIIFAGVFTALIVWLLHGFWFRWRRTRLSDEAIEGLLERAGLAIRSGCAKLRIG
jgi:lipid A 4'-phosphatase